MALCPRCDYDLSGEIATWVERCPVRGRCPECGLELEWRTVFNRAAAPRWSVEHAGPGAFARTAAGSVLRALLPGTLWRRLTLSMPVVPRRLAALVLVWLPASYVIGVVAVLLLMGGESYAWWSLQATWYSPGPPPGPSWVDEWILKAQREPVRWAFPYFDLHAAVPGLFGKGVGSGLPPAYFAITATFGLMLPAAMAVMPASLRRARVRGRHLVRLTAYWMVVWLLLALVPTVIDSLARQWQVWTAVYESRAPKPLAGRDFRLVQAMGWATRHTDILVGGTFLAVIVRYWWCALRHYLRIPNALVAACSLVLIALLGTAFIMYFLAGATSEIVGIFEQFSLR